MRDDGSVDWNLADSGEVIEDGVKCTDFKDIMLTSMKFGEGEG